MFKTTTLAFVAIAASATFASADSYISNFVEQQNSASQVELGTVVSDGAGVVEVYGYHAGEIGALLGSTDVMAGANANVDVNIRTIGTDAIALLKVGGEIVDTQELEFN